MPDELSTGELLQMQVEMKSATQVLANYNYTPEVICSYDPNDKLVMPSDLSGKNVIQQEEKLTYTIRFQNEGNAEAIDIYIQDTIDSNLDLSTFRVVDSSFPVLTSVYNNAIQFDFENIWLPPKSLNEVESQGYVSYSIVPYPNLTPGEAIENEAFIYFDFNAPIRTNTTVNTLFDPTTVEDITKKEAVIIQPNPANDFILINTKSNIELIEIHTLNGQLSYRGNDRMINVSAFTPGLHIVKVKVDGDFHSELISIVH